MVGKAILPRGHGLEQGREAALTLHVDQGLVLRLPVQGRERFAFQDQPQWQAGAGILPATDPGPHGEVVHELQQLEVLAVADDRAQDLAHEAALDAVPLSSLLVVVLIIAQGFVAAGRGSRSQAPGVGGTLGSLAHFGAPVQRWPERAL